MLAIFYSPMKHKQYERCSLIARIRPLAQSGATKSDDRGVQSLPRCLTSVHGPGRAYSYHVYADQNECRRGCGHSEGVGSSFPTNPLSRPYDGIGRFRVVQYFALVADRGCLEQVRWRALPNGVHTSAPTPTPLLKRFWIADFVR